MTTETMKKHIRYDVIFVLNGLQNGEEGCYAHDLMGKQLADGWYYLTDIDDDVVNSKRCSLAMLPSAPPRHTSPR